MRNITIKTDDKTAKWARVWAAKRDTSLSNLLGEHLRKLREQEEGREQIAKRLKSRKPVILRSSEQTLPARDALHER